MEQQTAQSIIAAAQRVIIKVGSATVTKKGSLRKAWLNVMARDIAALQAQGKEVIVVTSGAGALGRSTLDIPHDKPSSEIAMGDKQAAAAAGQPLLHRGWRKALKRKGVESAQVLLTPHDCETQKSRINICTTFAALAARGIVPVINENDTVATREITFGDNDQLAAELGTVLTDAHHKRTALIIFSTTDGLYTGDPRKNDLAKHIPLVERLDDVRQYAGENVDAISTGGMKSKLDAAEIATQAGMDVIIASGARKGCLSNLQTNTECKSTLILARR